MTSATALHLRLVECCCAATIPRTSISKPSCPSLSLRQIPFSHSSVQLKSNHLPSRIVPFVSSDEGLAATAFESTEVESGEEENVDEADAAEESQPLEEAKVFVGNLPYDIDSAKLAQIFEKAGVVEVSEVIYNRQTDQSRGFGFVTMSTVEEAEKAVEMYSGYDIGGRILTVNKAAPRGSQMERVVRTYEPSFRMYVGNLPWQVDSDRLVELFSEHGKVVDAKVVLDRETGRSRGFGFVTMASETELNDAIAALDGQSLDGRAIRVNVAEERPRRAF